VRGADLLYVSVIFPKTVVLVDERVDIAKLQLYGCVDAVPAHDGAKPLMNPLSRPTFPQ